MAYSNNKSPKELSELQMQYIKELGSGWETSERPTTDEAVEIYTVVADDLVYRGFDKYEKLTKYGRLAESIMDFIEDNYPELFCRGRKE